MTMMKDTTHVINCDADPFVPEGWAVEEHIKGGEFVFDASQVVLYLDERQKRRPWLQGHKLREALRGKPVANANVLDYLLAHPEIIPEDWKGKFVFFFGTIYRSSDDDLYVRCLYWYGDRWYWFCNWLDRDWYDFHPVALRASALTLNPSDTLSLEARVAELEAWRERMAKATEI